MDIEAARSEFNDLSSKNSKLYKPLLEKKEDNENLLEEMERNICEENLKDLVINMEDLKNNAKQIVEIMKEQHSITKDILILMDKLSESLENKNTLSDYRDWVTYFNLALKAKLKPKIWAVIKFAVYRKVEENLMNYAEDEIEPISKLETVLKEVNMSLYEY